MQQVVILAPTDFTNRRLNELPQRGRCAFHAVLAYDDLLSNTPRSFDDLLDEATAEFQALERVDAVAAFWDFPATPLAAVLASTFRVPGPKLESVIACEHKHWARRIQQEAAPEVVPRFERVDPFARGVLDKLPMEPPFWVKPVKSASSMLGFRIDSRDDFERAIEATRERIHIYGRSFEQALARCALPEDLRRWGGQYCVAESLIGGDQVTLEGYVSSGHVQFHGAVDSIRHSNGSTFSRYEYPSRVPPAALARMREVTRKVLRHARYADGCFNAEFFYDSSADAIWLVEINPRISQSHAKIMQLVDGSSNLSELVSCALGEAPPERPGGEFSCAAKLFYRSVLEDGDLPDARRKISRG